MKKLYGKQKIHPSHSHQPSVISDQYLSFLPATILTLTVALSVGDREVLAYLISCSAISSSSSSVVKLYSNRSNNNSSNTTAYKKSCSRSKDHPVLFNCNCFTCYMSYWVRWDSSSNRQLIHEIIDAYEDEFTTKKVITNRKKDRRNNKKRFHGSNCFDDLKNSEERRRRNMISGNEMGTGGKLKSVEMMIVVREETGEEEEDDEAGESGSIMNFLLSKILDVWNQYI